MPASPRLALLAAALFSSATAFAGEAKPIQDNSFLLEEAYNQEPGVIQHISLFQRDRATGDWVYAFTEEWPALGQSHQASITVPVLGLRQADGARRTGLGDVALNYRWQAVGDGEAPVAVAPRLTALLPTGDDTRGHGAGGIGAQVNLPVSATLGPHFVGHFNLGATFNPSARTDLGRGRQSAVNLGQGLVWLLHPNVNLMLEASYLIVETDTARGTVRSEVFLLSPGVRGAVDLPLGVQMVAGVGFPLGFGPSSGERAVLGYLSFEHAAWNAGER
jgi:Putative MetA-pathway of phenol degradation